MLLTFHSFGALINCYIAPDKVLVPTENIDISLILHKNRCYNYSLEVPN